MSGEQHEQQGQLHQFSTTFPFEQLKSFFTELITQNRQLKEQVNRLEKQSEQNYHTFIYDLKKTTKSLNQCVERLNDQSKKNEELQNDIDKLKEHINKYKNSLNQPVIDGHAGLQIDQQHNLLETDTKHLIDEEKHISDVKTNHKHAATTDGYIQTLQTKLIGFLNDYIKLLDNSDTVLYRTFIFPDAIPITQNLDRKGSIDEIQHKIRNVEVLQIRMPIVASMKAGKSTIINALIGSEFLPRRTALPISVVLKLGESRTDDISPAQLVLEDETLKALENLQSGVIKILKENFRDDKELDTLLLSNSHLFQTIKALRNDEKLMLNLENKLEDSKQVQDMLTFINELVHISIYLSSCQPSISLSLDAFVKNIPAIHVNYRPVSDIQKNFRQKCQVLLIDTPELNEAAGVIQLGRFVTNELQKVDVILFVVEYGHLNTESDAKIADEIKKIRHLKKNQECIYVLINKVDLYKRKDMSKNELRKHVASAYNVPENFVFHSSRSHALIAQKFLADKQKNGDKLQVNTSNTAKDVLEACCPVDWLDRIEECKLDEVEKYAKRLYDKSGVSDVLDSVLKTVVSQVVRRCIQSAIEVCTRMSKNLITDVDIRLHGLQLIEDRLRREIEDLNQDLADLADIEKGQLVSMKEISATLEDELKVIFNNTLNEYEKQVKQILYPEYDPWCTAADGYAVSSARGGAVTPLGMIIWTVLGSAVVQNLIEYLHGDSDDVKFNNAEDAKKFINDITEIVNELSKNIYNVIEKQVTNACNKSCTNFYSQISERMKGILHCANDRLSSIFDVNPIVPKKIDLKLKEIHLDVEDIGRMQQYRPTLFGLVPTKLTESGPTWLLSRSKLQEKCVESVKVNLERIQIDMVEHINNEMKQNFTPLFNDLQAYLIKYKAYAEIWLSDRKLTEENQAYFKSKLQELKECLTTKAQEVDDFTEGIDWEKLV